MLYFDSHVHLGNFKISLNEYNKALPGYKSYKTNTIEKCRKEALANSVSKLIIFPFPLMEFPFHKQNAYVLEAYKKYPYLFIPFYLPDTVERLSINKEHICGIKDHFYFDIKKQVSRKEMFDFIQQENKIYIFHAHYLKWQERIEYICKNFPNIKVVIAHSARPIPFMDISVDDRIKEIKKIIPKRLLENFFFETSTIRNSLSIEKLVNAFGAEHIIFGSDYPYYSDENENVFDKELKIILNTNISDSDKEKILAMNFRKLFQKEKIWIRHAVRNDANVLSSMINKIPEKEQKFLALNLKISHIRSLIKTGSHILVAETDAGNIIGFIRGSDRNNNGLMMAVS